MSSVDDWARAKAADIQRRIAADLFGCGDATTTANESAEAADVMTVEKLNAMIRALGVKRIVLVSTVAPADQVLLIDHDKISEDSPWRIAFPADETRPDVICSPPVWPHLRAYYEGMGASISEPTGPEGAWSRFYTVMIPPPKPRPHPGAITIPFPA